VAFLAERRWSMCRTRRSAVRRARPAARRGPGGASKRGSSLSGSDLVGLVKAGRCGASPRPCADNGAARPQAPCGAHFRSVSRHRGIV